MSEDLKELYAGPSGDLKVVAKFSGKEVYTSNELKRKFLTAVASSGILLPAIKTIKDLLNRDLIIPVYKTKSIIKSILRLSPIELSGIMGAASPEHKKLYVFVDASTNLFLFSNNNSLSKVTLHELMHLVAILKPKDFYSIFKDHLEKFYEFYFCRVLSANKDKVDKKNLEELVRFIFFDIESKPNFTLGDYRKRLQTTFLPATTLRENMAEEMILSILKFVYIVFKLESYGEGYKVGSLAFSNNFKSITLPLYATYKAVFNLNPYAENQLLYQELFTPSEIICTHSISKTPDKKIYLALTKI